MPADPRPSLFCTAVSLVVIAGVSYAADWNRFRGPNGSGVSPDKQNTPVKWSDSENLNWKASLPGPGLSSPIVVGDRVFVTCWSGYGVEGNRGEQKDLKRHLVCVDRKTGEKKWATAVDAVLPEDRYSGMFTQHGYASHTPVSDGERVYAFFGKTGVVAFDLKGEKLWQTSVGTGSGINGWGTASSPILYKNLVIVNAAAESETIYALNKADGEVVWKQDSEGYKGNWGTPILVDAGNGRTDLVLAVPYEIWGLNPENGKLRWYCDGIDTDSMCASAVAHGDVVYVVGGQRGGTVAVRAGGKGDVNKTHVVWRGNDRGRIGTPLVHKDRLYFVSNKVANCVDTKTGKRVFQGRMSSGSGDGGRDRGGDRRGGGRGGFGGGGFGRGGFGGGMDYSSPVVADGKLYYFSRSGESFVVKTGEKFELLAQNRFEDGGEFSATPAISEGQLFVRSTKYLYCIAESGDAQE